MPVFSPKESARLAAQLTSPPLTWMRHSFALRNGSIPGSNRCTNAPSDRKSRDPSGGMFSPYFIWFSVILQHSQPLQNLDVGGKSEEVIAQALVDGHAVGKHLVNLLPVPGAQQSERPEDASAGFPELAVFGHFLEAVARLGVSPE